MGCPQFFPTQPLPQKSSVVPHWNSSRQRSEQCKNGPKTYKTELAAADIERACLVARCRVRTTLGLCIAIRNAAVSAKLIAITTKSTARAENDIQGESEERWSS